jgi:hypothetical protein
MLYTFLNGHIFVCANMHPLGPLVKVILRRGWPMDLLRATLLHIFFAEMVMCYNILKEYIESWDTNSIFRYLGAPKVCSVFLTRAVDYINTTAFLLEGRTWAMA